VGLALGPDGSLYAAEFSRNFPKGDRHGDVVRVAPDGTRTRLGVDRLFNPGGVAVGPDGSVYVSNWSTLTGRSNRAGHRGQVVRIGPRPR
jgi:sugar lactone lactonase YvrE